MKKIADKPIELSFKYFAKDNEAVRIRIDRLTGYTPFIYTIKVN